MSDKLARLWRSFTTSRYTASLEAELTRLRTENKDLMNALLCASNLPMLPSHEPSKPLPLSKPRLLPSQFRQKLERMTEKIHEGREANG